MLDLALFLSVIGMFLLGLRKPFIWVLAYLYIDILAPQKIGWSLAQLLPVSLVAFLLAFGGWAVAEKKDGFRFSFRQGILLALLIWCFITLQWADYPDSAAEKWAWVWKALIFAIFLPLTLTTRLRIESAMLIMVLTAGAIIISAGLKTVGGGGGYGNLYLFVNDNSNIYESSTLATVSIALIPIILWFTRHGTIFPPDWRVKGFAAALIFACLMIPIGTEARTGLLCIAVLGMMLLRDVKKRFVYIGAAAALGLVSLPFLPSSFTDRMATIKEAQSEQSASTRMQVWAWTLDYVERKPLGGGFDVYIGNSFSYQMPVKEVDGNTTRVRYREVTESSRAFHSSWFEMLGEQGWPGLFIWTLLHITGIVQMERIRRRYAGKTGKIEGWQGPLASALQFSNVIYLVGATFQGIAFQPVILMLVGLQIALAEHVKRRESAIDKAAFKAVKAANKRADARGSAPDPAIP
ncbi:DUF5935 domain-containing protein [Qipengyuania psychrotolerans]|uniref:O-antigen ligase family protein n=1 Tax=Qipengyuania psychrotolerans TaxID=2867238 RepID=A0ABX8ZDC2_9SPHN|nr:DUF5935 domain-containing protein [Qipengyuania psychrotolerans]QZD86904.1 O-antigen ligase family protein [Qipengyuania psychrotolerans]